MAVYQVILSTDGDDVFELTVHAPDAVSAVAQADVEIRAQQADVVATNVHARHISDNT